MDLDGLPFRVKQSKQKGLRKKKKKKQVKFADETSMATATAPTTDTGEESALVKELPSSVAHTHERVKKSISERSRLRDERVALSRKKMIPVASATDISSSGSGTMPMSMTMTIFEIAALLETKATLESPEPWVQGLMGLQNLLMQNPEQSEFDPKKTKVLALLKAILKIASENSKYTLMLTVLDIALTCYAMLSCLPRASNPLLWEAVLSATPVIGQILEKIAAMIRDKFQVFKHQSWVSVAESCMLTLGNVAATEGEYRKLEIKKNMIVKLATLWNDPIVKRELKLVKALLWAVGQLFREQRETSDFDSKLAVSLMQDVFNVWLITPCNEVWHDGVQFVRDLILKMEELKDLTYDLLGAMVHFTTDRTPETQRMHKLLSNGQQMVKIVLLYLDRGSLRELLSLCLKIVGNLLSGPAEYAQLLIQDNILRIYGNLLFKHAPDGKPWSHDLIESILWGVSNVFAGNAFQVEVVMKFDKSLFLRFSANVMFVSGSVAIQREAANVFYNFVASTGVEGIKLAMHLKVIHALCTGITPLSDARLRKTCMKTLERVAFAVAKHSHVLPELLAIIEESEGKNSLNRLVLSSGLDLETMTLVELTRKHLGLR